MIEKRRTVKVLEVFDIKFLLISHFNIIHLPFERSGLELLYVLLSGYD